MSDQSAAGGTTAESMVGRIVPYLLLAGLGAVLLRNALTPVTNADTLFHLRFGHEFLGPWPLRDPGTVSSLATAPWTPTQWLPQVVMAQAETWFGMAGVSWLTTAQIMGFAAAVLVACRHRASLLVAATVTLLVAGVAAGGLSGRPQVLSYLFTAVTVDAWLRTRADGRVRWWLVPLTWLWAMCHGMWPVALVIGAVAVTGGLLDRSTTVRRATREAAVVAGSLVAAGLTPVGPALYRAVVAVGERSDYIPEWSRPDFLSPHQLVLVAMVAGYLLIRLRGPAVSWTETLFLLLACAWAVYSARTAPTAAIVLAPLLASALQSVLPTRRRPVTRRERRTLIGAAAGLLALLAVVLPSTTVTAAPYPEIDRALDAVPDGTVVLDEWTEGGYLLWRHPDLDIGMHGYLDTYTLGEIEAGQQLLAAGPGWTALLERSRARYAVLASSTPLVPALEARGWQIAARSGDVVLLHAPS